MPAELVYPIIVIGAFSSFLLTFLYAILRWSLVDARSRGTRGWPLAALMVGAPVLTLLARAAFRSSVPRSLSLSILFGVPLLAWAVWLFIRPPRREEPGDDIVGGRDGVASRWILILSLTASGYGVAVVWLTQFVMYPLYLSVPPAAFPEYYARFLVAIVFPVIVALSLSWALAALLILNRPRAIPSWAPWSAAGLALAGFIASQGLEAPYNQQLLEHGYDAAAIHSKIAFNWYRLTAWTLQAGLLAWMTNLALSAAGSKGTPATGDSVVHEASRPSQGRGCSRPETPHRQ